MDELPRDVKKFIEQVRRADVPTARARRRIWQRLQAAMVVPIRLHPSAMGRVAKVAVAASLIAALGSVGYLLRSKTQRSYATAHATPIAGCYNTLHATARGGR